MNTSNTTTRTRAAAGLLIVTVFIVLFSATASAASVDTVTMLSGEERNVTVDIGGTVENMEVVGPITVKSRSTQNGVLTLQVEATDPGADIDNGKIYISTENASEHQVTVRVVPYDKYKSKTDINNNTRESASNWDSFEDQWVNKRVDRKKTSEGVVIVYEQRLPYLGEVNENGVPTGEWVEVGVNETTMEPQWIYETPSGAMTHMAKQAHQNQTFRRNTWLGASFIAITPFIFVFVVLPRYRERKERKAWGPVKGGNQ